MNNKKQTLIAFALIAMAATTIAYAQLLTGTFTVTTEEAVSISPITDTFAARSSGNETYSNVIAINFTKGGFVAGDKVTVAVELVVTDPTIYSGFLSLVIEVVDSGGNVKATLTKNEPYADFALTLSSLTTQYYSVKIIYQTGDTVLTNVTMKLSASVKAVLS